MSIYSGAENVQDFDYHIPSFTFGCDPKIAVQQIVKIIDSMDATTMQRLMQKAGEMIYCLSTIYSQCYRKR